MRSSSSNSEKGEDYFCDFGLSVVMEGGEKGNGKKKRGGIMVGRPISVSDSGAALVLD